VIISRPLPRMTREAVDAIRKLSLVRVILSGVDLKSRFDVLMPLVGPSHHAQDCLLQYLLRLALQHVRRSSLFQSTRITGMPSVQLILPLFACEFNLVGVDYHDVVPNVLIGGVGRLVLPPEDWCHGGGEPTHGLIVGVD